MRRENSPPWAETVSQPFGWERDGTLRAIGFLLFYAVLANLPVWIAGRWLGILSNGWFSLDYIAVGLLALFLPRFAVACLLLLAMCADLLAGVCETYYFTPDECFTNFDGVREFDPGRHVAMAVVALMVLAVAFAVPYLLAPSHRKYRVRLAACLIGFAVVCLSIDEIGHLRRTGGSPGSGSHPGRAAPTESKSGDATETRFSRIPMIRLVREEIALPAIGQPMQRAAALGLTYAGAPKKGGVTPNFVLVLVEAWGRDSEAAVSEALVSPYAQPALLARYQVSQGMVPFNGPTAVGEARELCGSTMGYHIMIASARELKDCLPKRLEAEGYHAVALHGMDGGFYSRSRWYQSIGFQEIWFEDRFQKLKMPVCVGSFTGICDPSIAGWMAQKLERDKATPDFLYWVTLNSHLPVLVPSPVKNGASCDFTPSLSQQPSLCSWYQLEAEVHRSVAALAMADVGRPTVFVIVGDHAPPFSDATLRGRFAPDSVPYVLLVPREVTTVPVAAAGVRTSQAGR